MLFRDIDLSVSEEVMADIRFVLAYWEVRGQARFIEGKSIDAPTSESAIYQIGGQEVNLYFRERLGGDDYVHVVFRDCVEWSDHQFILTLGEDAKMLYEFIKGGIGFDELVAPTT